MAYGLISPHCLLPGPGLNAFGLALRERSAQ
jgi:hypothetical protein